MCLKITFISSFSLLFGKLRNTIYTGEGEKLDEEAIKKKMQEINEMFDCSGKKNDNIFYILVCKSLSSKSHGQYLYISHHENTITSILTFQIQKMTT